jgi:hypothetical protein
MTDTNFVMLGPRDAEQIRRLLEAISGLGDAPEYLALEPSNKRLPYIVAARASEYWERLEREQQWARLKSLAAGLESLAADRDPAIQDLVVTILQPLATESPLAQKMKGRLGPNATALLERFIR